MENYLNERRLSDILTLEIDNWRALSTLVDQQKSKSNSTLFSKIGVKVRDPLIQPKVKIEGAELVSEMPRMSEEDMKSVMTLVQRVRQVYSIVYESLPSDIRAAVNVDVYGNGARLWVWLEERLRGNTIDVQNEIMSELFNAKQNEGELFETWKVRIDDMNHRLSQTNEDLKPSMYRFVLLSKLRPEYQQMTTALDLTSEYKEANGDGVAMWQKISLAIARFERQQLKQSDSGIEDAAVMVARGAPSGSNNRPRRSAAEWAKVECYNCHKMGHLARWCRSKAGEVEPPSSGEARMAAAEQIDNKLPPSSPAYVFTARAVVPRPLWSEVVCMGMTPTARRKPEQTKTTTPTTAAESMTPVAGSGPKPTKRLIRPSDPVPSLAPAAASSSVPTQNRFESLRDLKSPGPTSSKAGKPMEKRLKLMTWGIDTMASVHCTGNKAVFVTRRRCTPMRILCANDDSIVANEVGTVKLRVRTATGNVITLPVQDVYYCKDLGANLLSGVKLVKDLGLKMTMSDSGGELTSSQGTQIPLNMRSGLLTIEGDAPALVYAATAKGLVISTSGELMATHVRLGHIGVDRLVDLLKSKKTRGLGQLDMSKEELVKAREQVIQCVACREGKGTNAPHSGAGTLNHGSRPG